MRLVLKLDLGAVTDPDGYIVAHALSEIAEQIKRGVGPFDLEPGLKELKSEEALPGIEWGMEVEPPQ